MLEQAGVFEFADVRVDMRAYRLTRGEREIALEPKAFAVLLEFISHTGEMLSRDALLDAVWGHRYVTPATLNRIIVLLRRALGDDPEAPRYIQTVRGRGYRFVAGDAPVDEDTVPAPPALRFAPPAHAHVPARVAEIIGRDREIADIDAQLGPARALTIVGAGGMGKTTVALEVARARGADFADGIWFFDLAPHRDGDSAARAIAETFGAREGENPSQQRKRLIAMLQTRRALLVLDNCERIAHELGAFVAELLAACPQIAVLATSQRRLDCVGERIYALPALAMPPTRRWNDAQALAELAAIASPKLLITRARALAAPVELTAANADSIAELCRHLDGMPLALELAAVRLRVLDPAQLLAHLDERFRWLGGSGRPERHQTLGVLMAWSFALLDEAQRRLLCALSVFGGSWILDAAIDIAAAFGFDAPHTVDLLTALADHSLIAIDTNLDPPSYRLLDSVRLYARARLAEGADEVLARRAHFSHLHHLSARAGAVVHSPAQSQWIRWLQREADEIEQALDFAASLTDLHAPALNLVANLTWYIRAVSEYRRSQRWFEHVLDLVPDACADRARVLISTGVIAHHRRDHALSERRFRGGIDLARTLHLDHLAAAGEAVFAFELVMCGRLEEARDHLDLALAAAEQDDDPFLRSLALLSRGLLLGTLEDHAGAVRDMELAAAAVDRADGDLFQLGYTLINLALQHYLSASMPGAARCWLRTMDIMTQLAHWRGVAGCIEGSAYLAAHAGEYPAAARFLAAAAHGREQSGAPLLAQWFSSHDTTLATVRSALGAETFARVQSDPSAQRIEEVAIEARALLQRMAGTGQSAANTPPGS